MTDKAGKNIILYPLFAVELTRYISFQKVKMKTTNLFIVTMKNIKCNILHAEIESDATNEGLQESISK